VILVARRHHAFRDCVSSAACVGHHQNKNAREGALVASFFECRRSLRVAPLAREVPTSITILNAPRRRISNGRLRHVLHGARRPTRRKKRRCNIAPASHVSAQPAWIALVADACWSRGGLSPIDEAGDVAERMPSRADSLPLASAMMDRLGIAISSTRDPGSTTSTNASIPASRSI
jgi:hypothetical protein